MSKSTWKSILEKARKGRDMPARANDTYHKPARMEVFALRVSKIREIALKVESGG